MNIVINEKNIDRIQAELDKVQIKSRVRTITAKDILRATKTIEQELRIPKKSMTGIKASVDLNAESFPNAYHGIPYSTHFALERTATAWKVTGISRNQTRSEKRTFVLTLTDEAKDAIIKSKMEF